MRFLFLMAILLTSNISMAGKGFTCKGIEGPDFKEVVNFNPSLPLLESIIVEYNPDGSKRSEERNFYLSTTSACGVAVNWKDCTSAATDTNSAYSFSFQCLKLNLSGTFSVDKFHTARFLCNGKVALQATECSAI